MTSGMQLVVFPTKDLDGAKKIFSTLDEGVAVTR